MDMNPLVLIQGAALVLVEISVAGLFLCIWEEDQHDRQARDTRTGSPASTGTSFTSAQAGSSQGHKPNDVR